MIDVGLMTGAQTLRDKDLLKDYTIVVEGHEFRVHKFVLAAVSDYFQALLTGGMKESSEDKVELKGLSADTVHKMLDLIYTGNEAILNENETEIMQCAVYLQMPSVIDACKARMLKNLTVVNCLNTLSTFLMYSLKETSTVKKYIHQNWSLILTKGDRENISSEVLLFLMKNWPGTEFDLFKGLADWICPSEIEKHEAYVNELMSSIRFCLMTLKELGKVKRTSVYKSSNGSWKAFVDYARNYLKKPLHQRVLDTSEQTRVRNETAPVLFAYSGHSGTIFTATKSNQWKELKVGTVPCSTMHTFTETNNFLIGHTMEYLYGQINWSIFDPRTMSWSDMAVPPTVARYFTLTFHCEHLYLMGGLGPGATPSATGILSKAVYRYSFQTNTWALFDTTLPVPIQLHAACALDDNLYISGGWEKETMTKSVKTARFDCLNLTSKTWTKKAPLMQPSDNHTMNVMKICGQDFIVSIDPALQLDLYDPRKDQWVVYTVHHAETDLISVYNKYDPLSDEYSLCENSEWGSFTKDFVKLRSEYSAAVFQGCLLVTGNALYLVYATSTGCLEYPGQRICHKQCRKRWVSLKVEFSGADRSLAYSEFGIPLKDYAFDAAAVGGAMLAIPAQMLDALKEKPGIIDRSHGETLCESELVFGIRFYWTTLDELEDILADSSGSSQ